MQNVVFSLLVYCLSFLAQPFASMDAYACGHTPQITAAKTIKSDIARPSAQVTPETLIVRDGGTSIRFSSKPWHPAHGFFGALLALGFNFEPKSVESLGNNYSLPPFHPSPFQYYEILLI